MAFLFTLLIASKYTIGRNISIFENFNIYQLELSKKNL